MTLSRLARFWFRPRGLLILGVLAGSALLAGPHVLAWRHLRAGRSALEHCHNQSARDHLQRCLQTWPDSVQARVLAARAARRAGDLDEGNRHLDWARRQGSEAWAEEIALEWALLRAAMGDLATVEEPLQARLQKLPVLAPLIWEALAEGYRRMCRLREALHCLDSWLAVEPNNAYAYFLRGEIHRQIGAVNRARDEYRRTVELDPQHHQARRYLVRCLVQVGRYQEALEHLEVLQQPFADDPELAVHQARCRHDLGHKAEAVGLLEQVLAADPACGLALKERGRQAQAAEQFAQAESWLRRAVQALPFDYEAHWALYQALQYQGKVAEAKVQMARAQQLKDRLERINAIASRDMTLRPLDAVLQGELGILLVSVGHQESGLRWLLNAVQLDPRQPTIHAALADYYQQAGDAAKAARHRHQARKDDSKK